MLFIIYLMASLLVCYTHAHGCLVRGVKYPWKEDILLCLLWPVVVPLGIFVIIASEGKP